MDLKIEYLSPSELKPYENNARKHGKVDIEGIKASITQFGFNDPIGVWKDNIIIEGHGRLMAAKALGIVLDLFNGSGTTIMACEQNGRCARCMELDPRYVDAAIKRWEDFTGQKAELIKE